SFLLYRHFQNNLLFFYLPVLTMALCDPIAALVGRHWPRGRFQINNGNKTVTGSLAFFICSVILTIASYYFFSKEIFNPVNVFLTAFVIAICATVTEALSTKGFDNITIPICVGMVLILFHA
ncbi:MAG: phosphatidate cytidylyltransferase, partial [Ginsengibacter sp.]